MVGRHAHACALSRHWHAVKNRCTLHSQPRTLSRCRGALAVVGWLARTADPGSVRMRSPLNTVVRPHTWEEFQDGVITVRRWCRPHLRVAGALPALFWRLALARRVFGTSPALFRWLGPVSRLLVPDTGCGWRVVAGRR